MGWEAQQNYTIFPAKIDNIHHDTGELAPVNHLGDLPPILQEDR